MYPNGRAPASALVRVFGSLATPEMAQKVTYVKNEYDRTHDDQLIVNEIYRTYDAQVFWRDYWVSRGLPGNAAVPGHSNHGDDEVGAVDWSSADVAGRHEIAAQVGLIHDIPGESWHATNRYPSLIELPALFDTDTPKRKKRPTMYIYWTTAGVSMLAAGGGVVALDEFALGLFRRLIASDQSNEKPETFTPEESHYIGEYLRKAQGISDADLTRLSGKA